MKRFVIIAALGLASAFAITLANVNADETTPSTRDARAKATQPTTACTNASGTTFKPGETGYKECMKEMNKGKQSEQMGGRADTQSEPSNTDSPMGKQDTPPTPEQAN